MPCDALKLKEKVQGQVTALLAKDKPDSAKLGSKQSEFRTIFNDVYFRHAERSIFSDITKVGCLSLWDLVYGI